MSFELGPSLALVAVGTLFPAYLGLGFGNFVQKFLARKTVLAVSFGIVLFMFLDLMAETAQLALGASSLQLQLGLWMAFAFGAILLVGLGQGVMRSGYGIAALWAIGVAFHGAGEGVVVGADFLSGQFELTVTQATSFALHKLLEAFSIAALYSAGGMKWAHTLVLGTIAALPVVLGFAATLVGFPFAASTPLFAAGAGSCIFALSRMSPEKGSADLRFVLAVLVGVVLMYLAGLLHEF